MNRMITLALVLLACALQFTLQAQSVNLDEVEPGRFDFGRMWTFENPPKEYFKDTYGMDVTDEWLEDVQRSALRFSTFCTASFVSPNGLIMTNHHCARGVVGAAQQEGEDFDANGFYAKKLEDERKIEGLFVDQLVQIDDITEMVKKHVENAQDDAQRAQLIQEALAKATEEYGQKEGWEGLTVQPVTYYSGGKYSIYGYKRYNDIRVVLLPELDLGYYGGDPDNFTYPRYNLDCTFFRAYDEEGNAVNSSENYYKFNTDGVHEDEPVFVVGNPGSTERYRTVAQLEYDRDNRYPVQLGMMMTKYDMMQSKYEAEPNDQLKNQIFSYSNGIKAYTGILEGLNDEILFARKEVMENNIRSEYMKKPGAKDYWAELAANYEQVGNVVAELVLLNPFVYGEQTLPFVHQLDNYMTTYNGDATDEELLSLRSDIVQAAEKLNSPLEKVYLANWLTLLQKHSKDDYLDKILKGRTPEQAANELLSESFIASKPDKAKKMLQKNPEKLAKKDELWMLKDYFVSGYKNALTVYQKYNATNKALENKISNAFFQVHGSSTPPDATFTLRISDGLVKSYEYNGTVAPIYTTYFGLYDRHYSNKGQFPWSLPDRWKDPEMGLLKSPLNFVSTNDIIGGNSGSAIINKNKEAVGLIFDGNIESLPGNFIFDEEKNRSVSVHAGGMVAAMKYVYKADRVIKELTK